MKLDATLFDNRNSNYYNIAQLVGDIEISSYIEDQPGKCTFNILKKDNLAFWEGATVAFKVDGSPMFKGFVFTKKRSKNTRLISVTAYDQLRYLKNKDAYVFEGKTSNQIFTRICSDFVLNHKVVDSSSYICSPRTNDGKPLYDIIKYSLQDTLINTGEWFIIRDNFGVLEHINVKSLNSGVIIGDAASLVDFEYVTSIDKDVYNQIKLYQDNKDKKTRHVYLVNDTKNSGQTIKEWGILQLWQAVPENLNYAQIQARADGMLSLYNNVKRTLKLQSLGHPKIFAGASIYCKIADLGDISLDNTLLVTECVHKISSGEHMMQATVEVVV